MSDKHTAEVAHGTGKTPHRKGGWKSKRYMMVHGRSAALEALRAYPGGLQLGGGVTADNAGEYLDAGASHVIVTSYVFREGQLDEDRLRELVCGQGVDPA